MASSSSCFHWRYDVFLNFRGKDVRNSFISHLYEGLVASGIKTFKDDETLRKGKKISPELVNAINESRFFIVVFSVEYASSPWCLDELQSIWDHKQNCQVREILPIFYHVDPAQVRHQSGRYGEALEKLYEENVRENMDEKMHGWRAALTEVANLSGWHLEEGPESSWIKMIVGEISSKLERTFLEVAEYPVGLDSHLQQLSSLLELQSINHVRLVGIHGKAGIGKTSIAKHIYNLFAEQFEGHCFLSDIKAQLAMTSQNAGLAKLQKRLLRGILKDVNLKVDNADMGINLIRDRLGYKKVLIILDDVDSKEQLRKLAANVDWFGPGSRVVITTRDRKVLADHGVHWTYEVQKLNSQDSKRLLCWHAFKRSFQKTKPFEKIMVESAAAFDSGTPSALIKNGESLSRLKRNMKRGIGGMKDSCKKLIS